MCDEKGKKRRSEASQIVALRDLVPPRDSDPVEHGRQVIFGEQFCRFDDDDRESQFLLQKLETMFAQALRDETLLGKIKQAITAGGLTEDELATVVGGGASSTRAGELNGIRGRLGPDPSSEDIKREAHALAGYFADNLAPDVLEQLVELTDDEP